MDQRRGFQKSIKAGQWSVLTERSSDPEKIPLANDQGDFASNADRALIPSAAGWNVKNTVSE